MRTVEAIKIDDREIMVKELDVLDIKKLLASAAQNKTMTTLDLLFGNEIPGDAIVMSTGLSLEELEKFAPSELYKIVEVVKRLNPFFMQMVSKLIKVAEKMEGLQLPQTLTPASAD
jgi:predicted component of type VI protein secretion system